MNKCKFFTLLLIVLGFSNQAYSRDAAQDLKKLVGYTIISADSVNEVVSSNYSEKYVRLYGGWVFKVSFLLLDPLVMTDVIIFAKSWPNELTEQFNGKLPDHMMYSYKLLINNEIYDASPQQ